VIGLKEKAKLLKIKNKSRLHLAYRAVGQFSLLRVSVTWRICQPLAVLQS